MMESKANLIRLIQEEKLPPTAIVDCSDYEFLKLEIQELLQILICPNHSNPSDGCVMCKRFAKKLLTNVYLLNSGGQQIKKETLQTYIRDLSLFALEKSVPKVFVISLAEDLNHSSGNALLKFLEEPPENTFIFLLSVDYWTILPTIRSRCARYHFETAPTLSNASHLEKLIRTKSAKEFLILSQEWSKLPRKDLVADLQLAYKNLISSFYPQLIAPTLNLLDDLNHPTLDNLAIINYLIDLEKVIRE